MIKLVLAGLRYRTAAFLATFVAVLLGGAILVACGGLFESALRLSAPPHRLAAAPVVVTGSDAFKLPDEEHETVPYTERSGVDVAVLTKLSAVDGVRTAVPDVSFPAAALDKNGQLTAPGLTGHGWASAALTPYTLVSGGAPAKDQVAIDQGTATRLGVAPGSPITVAVDGAPRRFVLSGVVAGDAGPAVFVADADLAGYAPHRGRVDLIGVYPNDGVDAGTLAARVAAAVPGLTVVTGDDRGLAEFPGVAVGQLPMILMAAIFGGMVLVVMGIVVAATVGLSVRQRMRELALLRASGATPKQVHRMVVGETLAIAVLGALGGLALGAPAGSAIFALCTSRGIAPDVLEFRQGPIPFAAGLVLGIGMPLLAAAFAARPAAKARPIEALAEAAIPPVSVAPLRRTLAAVFAAATAGLALATPFLDAETASAVGGPAVLTGAITVALLGPELMVRAVDRAGPWLRRRFGANGLLAATNTRSRAVMFAAVLTPLTLATAIAVGNIYSQTTQSDAAIDAHADQLQPDAVVTSASGGIAPGLLDAVRKTPGVAAASPFVASQGWLEDPYDGSHGSDRWPLLGIEDGGVLATEVESGDLRALRGNTVAMPEDQADDLDLGVGSDVTLRLGDGTRARVKVVALLDAPSDYGSLVLPASLLVAHTSAGLPSHVLVRAADGQDPDDLIGAIAGRVATWPGATVGDEDALRSLYTADMNMQAWINYLLAGLAIAYAAIASVNTLAVAVLARRREFAVQRLAGATRRHVTRMLCLESGLIAVAALVLGTVIAAFTVLPMALASGAVIPSGPLWVYPAVIAVVFLIVWPVTVATARRAMSDRPIDAVVSAG